MIKTFLNLGVLLIAFSSQAAQDLSNNCKVRLATNVDSIKKSQLLANLESRGYTVVDSASTSFVLTINYKIDSLSGKCPRIEIGQPATCTVEAKTQSATGQILFSDNKTTNGCINAFQTDYDICSNLDQLATSSLPDCTAPSEALPSFNPQRQEVSSTLIGNSVPTGRGGNYDKEVRLGEEAYKIIKDESVGLTAYAVVAFDQSTNIQKWKSLPIENNNANVAVYNGMTIVAANVYNSKNTLAAYNAKTGELIWQTPNTSGDFIISDRAIFSDSTAGIVAVSALNGHPVWKSGLPVKGTQSLSLQNGIVAVNIKVYSSNDVYCSVNTFNAQSGKLLDMQKVSCDLAPKAPRPPNEPDSWVDLCDRFGPIAGEKIAKATGSVSCRAISKNRLAKLISIDLSATYLGYIDTNTFAGFDSLEVLYLNADYTNKLLRIEPGSFKNLKWLRVLALGSNAWTSIDPEIFAGLNSLEELDLSSNKLAEIPVGVFNGLPSLQRIDLSFNNISTIPPNSFNSLLKLRELFLYGYGNSALGLCRQSLGVPLRVSIYGLDQVNCH